MLSTLARKLKTHLSALKPSKKRKIQIFRFCSQLCSQLWCSHHIFTITKDKSNILNFSKLVTWTMLPSGSAKWISIVHKQSIGKRCTIGSLLSRLIFIQAIIKELQWSMITIIDTWNSVRVKVISHRLMSEDILLLFLEDQLYIDYFIQHI